MQLIHNVRLTLFLKPEEYIGNDKILQDHKQAMQSLIPVDFETEKIVIFEELVESFENRKIKILRVDIDKQAHCKLFIKTLKEMLGSEQCNTILQQKESRLDDELFFYIRLDRESLLKGIAQLTDTGDCYHIRMHIAAFPKKKQAALKVVEEIFSRLPEN